MKATWKRLNARTPIQPATETCASRTNDEGENKSSLAKDADGAATNTGGAIVGGAVAGPISAAVGGIVADHAGRMVGRIFGGKKKRENAADDCGQHPAVAAPGSGARSDPTLPVYAAYTFAV